MENLIYIVMLIIYLIFAGLKKLAEEKAIEKNKGKTVIPSGEPDVFKRLEKLKELKESMEKADTEGAPEPVVPEIPVLESSVEPEILVEPPTDIPVPVTEVPIPQLEIVFDEDTPEPTTGEKKESWGGGDTELAYREEKGRENILPSEFNLQQAFIWKEILDKPLALR